MIVGSVPAHGLLVINSRIVGHPEVSVGQGKGLVPEVGEGKVGDLALSSAVNHGFGGTAGMCCLYLDHPRESPTMQLSCSYFPVFGSPTATLEVVGNTGKVSSEKRGVGALTACRMTMTSKRLAET